MYTYIVIHYAIYASRWYVRNNVKIVLHGGDHSKEVMILVEYLGSSNGFKLNEHLPL